MKFKAKRRSKTEAEIPAWLQPTDSRAKKKPNNPTPFELPGWLRESEPRPEPRNTSPFSLEAEPHPCPAQETIERLCQQVALLERKLAYLQTLLFKGMAAQISGGDLASSVWAWLDCDQCREELACLVEKAAEQKVH